MNELERPEVSAIRRATAELLWAAAAPYPNVPAVLAMTHQQFDAGLLATAARKQWVAPLLWRSLSAAGATELLASDSFADIRSDAVRWWAKGNYLAGAVERSILPLRTQGLEPVVFKGAALVDRYGDRAVRPMGDIDILLPAGLQTKAVAALKDSGWKVAQSIDPLHHETILLHPEVPTFALELHVAFERWHERVTRLNSDEVWERRRPATILGTATHVLSPEDELMVLAAHAAKPFHCFDRMMWFADLAVAIVSATRNGGLDWDLVRRRATDIRGATVLAVALTQAARLRAEVPARLLTAMPKKGWRHTVLAPLTDVEWPLSSPDLVTRRRARYALCETWPRRAVLMCGESPYDPLWRQPLLVGRRARRAMFGLPRLRSSRAR